MKIDKKTIERMADLARLELTPDEELSMESQLRTILEYMDILSELDTKEVEPTAHTLGYTNVTREDRRGESLDVCAVERLAPEWKNGHVVVPRIV